MPPIRHRLGDGPRERIPLTYPGMSIIHRKREGGGKGSGTVANERCFFLILVPSGPRKIPEGYDD